MLKIILTKKNKMLNIKNNRVFFFNKIICVITFWIILVCFHCCFKDISKYKATLLHRCFFHFFFFRLLNTVEICDGINLVYPFKVESTVFLCNNKLILVSKKKTMQKPKTKQKLLFWCIAVTMLDKIRRIQLKLQKLYNLFFFSYYSMFSNNNWNITKRLSKTETALLQFTITQITAVKQL